MKRAILHVDMDAFFASVEIREQPALQGRAVVVAGRPEQRGVVAAASYAARRYGIHSAMPTGTALRLCPDLVILPPRHSLYAEVSAQIHAIFARYTPQVEPLSMDEAFLDVTHSRALFGDTMDIARQIKREIRDELQLVASVGVAPNKFLAKIASDIHKPDGFCVVLEEDIQAFLDPLPVKRLWGVGKVSAGVLSRLGIERIEQLRNYPVAVLEQHLGNSARHLLALAHGEDERAVESHHETRSISNEHTFAVDISEPRVLEQYAHELSEQVAWRCRQQGVSARTVQLKLRFADFTTITRSKTLAEPSQSGRTFRPLVTSMLRKALAERGDAIRLLGVGVQNIAEAGQARQMSLFEREQKADQRLDRLLDEARDRFGPNILARGLKTMK